jgi:hypothetical protein
VSNFECPTCNKFKLPNPASFAVGDKVKFMRIKRGLRTTSFNSVSGKIIALDGDDAVLVRSRGKDTRILRTGLTHEDQPSPVSYQMFGVCHCGGVL